MTRIIRDGGPWEDPVLQAVLKAQPASQEIGTSGESKPKPFLFQLGPKVSLTPALLHFFLVLVLWLLTYLLGVTGSLFYPFSFIFKICRDAFLFVLFYKAKTLNFLS